MMMQLFRHQLSLPLHSFQRSRFTPRLHTHSQQQIPRQVEFKPHQPFQYIDFGKRARSVSDGSDPAQLPCADALRVVCAPLCRLKIERVGGKVGPERAEGMIPRQNIYKQPRGQQAPLILNRIMSKPVWSPKRLLDTRPYGE